MFRLSTQLFLESPLKKLPVNYRDLLPVCFHRIRYMLRVNLRSAKYQGTPCSNQEWYLNLSHYNEIWTRSHLTCQRTFNHLANLAKWLSLPLQTKWLWVRVPLQSLQRVRFWDFLWHKSSDPWVLFLMYYWMSV